MNDSWSIELPSPSAELAQTPTTPAVPASTGPVALLPGIVLAAMIAGVAYSIRELPGLIVFSPMILSVIVGMIFSNVVGNPAKTRAGIGFAQRSLLRFAIVLLGFQLTIGQVVSIGGPGLAIVACTLVATFLFTLVLGRMIGVERGLAQLIAAGTSICGASAIVATNAVTGAREEDVAYAVASITLFGTVAMLLFPVLGPIFHLDQQGFGLWAGAAIHEVAQVIGASFQNGAQSGEVGTIAKLARVAMLAPMLLALGFVVRRGNSTPTSPAPFPWFVVAFVAVAALNSIVELPAEIRNGMNGVTTLLLSIGLAALGLQADIGEIRSRGPRPLILALSAFLFIAGFSLLLVKLVQ